MITQISRYNYITASDFDDSVLTTANGGSVAVPLPLNDNETEVSEGYLLVLEVDFDKVHPLDARRIQFLNRYILVIIEDDDSEFK